MAYSRWQQKPRLILVGNDHSIEPLGMLHLLGLAKACGWEARVVLVNEFDYSPLFRAIEEFKPQRVDFSLWTGWHMQTFPICDQIRRMGIKVAIGGPHATYSTAQCVPHADVVIKGDGFRNYFLLLTRQPLIGRDPNFPNVFFDPQRMAIGFPHPDRALLYEAYPRYAASPIKSIMRSEGCPFRCSYCYAPAFNRLYGGFELSERSLDSVIREVVEIQERWPNTRMIYFQDDIFGFREDSLREFVRRWKSEVGLPWHCQIRLELTEGDIGERRLDLFQEGGCTGITLAIESGNAFIRQYVLERAMAHELIVAGCRKIQRRGLTLRTEQILSVPFSDIGTDLGTLQLNNEINPEMAWTSILAPYGGTAMGTIASNFGIYTGANDDLEDSFFARSVLSHLTPESRMTVSREAEKRFRGGKHNPLVAMRVIERSGSRGKVLYEEKGVSEVVGEVEYLDEAAQNRYADQTVALQRLFIPFSRMPQGHELGRAWVELPRTSWNWDSLARITEKHLRDLGYGDHLDLWARRLAEEMGCSVEELPRPIAQNPAYFAFLPSGGALANRFMSESLFSDPDPSSQFLKMGTITRRHVFDHGLYKVASGILPEIATR